MGWEKRIGLIEDETPENETPKPFDAVVDSGTTCTYFDEVVMESFSKAWKEWVGVDYDARYPIGFIIDGIMNIGMKLTDEQLIKLPTILVQLEGKGNEHLDADET